MRPISCKMYLMAILLVVSPLLFGSGCQLPANYWATSWGDGLFLLMVGLTNTALGAATGGNLQI